MAYTGGRYLSSRLGRRMLGVFTLCALLPVTALALVSYRAARADLEGQARERLHDATKNLGMSMLERFLFVLEELEFAGERLRLGLPLGMVQEFPDRLVGIAHLDGDRLVARVGDTFSLSGLRPNDHKRLAAGEPAITFPLEAESGRPAAVIWYPLADGTHLAAAVEPDYGWGPGLQAVLPSHTDVIVLTPSGTPLLSTLATEYRNMVSIIGAATAGRRFDVDILGMAYFGGRWSLPLRHNFGHPGLVLIALAERSAAMQRSAGFGREYLLLGLTSLWIVLLLSISQIRRSLSPLDDLFAATKRVGERDFAHRVQISSHDEFRELGESFNFMAARLESQFAHLSMVAEIDRAILSSVEMDTVRARALGALQSSYSHLIFGLVMLDKDMDTDTDTEVATVYVSSEGGVRAERVFGTPASTFAAGHGQWVVFDDPAAMPACAVPLFNRGSRAVVAMPIEIGDRCAAALLVGYASNSAVDIDDLNQLRQVADQLGVALANATLVAELDDMKQGALLALAGAVDAKSSWTTGHSERVTSLSLRLARYLGVSAARLDIINRGGLLHDIGKIGVPNAILDKPGKLTDAEYEVMKAHPVIGARIIEPIHAYADVLPIILQHHERMDGRGYPYGIGREEFDANARIVAVADVFDACSSDRPYREGMPIASVMGIIREGSGSHFDAVVAEALDGLVAEDAEFFHQLHRAA